MNASPVRSDPPRGPRWRAARAAFRAVVLTAWRGVQLALLATAGLAALGAVAAWALVRHFEAGLPSVETLNDYQPSQVTRILARDGTVLAELFTERRTVVAMAALPAHVKLAVLAAEDAGFYEHEGVNYLGIARAFLVNLRFGGTRQGGSTITQQVVKNLLLSTRERTLARKIREALLARRLERDLSKDDILELYLNNIFFGRGRYGIEEAARDDFGKSAKDLTIAEAALIAGRIANPRDWSPRANLNAALSRRHYVLDQMHAKGFLTEADLRGAEAEPVTLAPLVEMPFSLAPEAVDLARAALARIAPEQARLGGFTVTTTIDPRLQLAARAAVREGLAAYDKRHALEGPLKLALSAANKKGKAPGPRDAVPVFEGTPVFEQHRVLGGVVAAADDAKGTFDVRLGTALGTVRLADFDRYNPGKLPPSEYAPIGARVRVSLLSPPPPVDALAKVPLRLEAGPEGALVALDVRSREILALVGSYEGAAGALDRATQSRRQPGSTFKPIVYSYAIHARRFTPATVIDPTSAVFAGGYRPSNFEGWQGRDPLRLREALANSVNVVAVRVLQDVGPANVVAWAQALGIQSTLKPDLSLALGSYEVHPMELAGAYGVFAAGGTYEEPRLIVRVVGPDGKEVALPPHSPPRRVLEEAEAYVVTDMLTSVIDHGTAARARALGRPLAGKTGTSNGPKDAWFAGYSTDIVAVTWVGYDDGHVLGASEQGAVTALPSWTAFMKAAHEGKPSVEFSRPAGLSTVAIDKRTGELAYPDDPDAMNEVFLTGTEPTSLAAPSEDKEGGL